MPKHINAASRLHAVLYRVSKGGTSGPSYKLWGSVFEVDLSQNVVSVLAVMEHLLWLQTEIDIVRRGMEATGFSENLYGPQLSKVLNALSPLSLGNDAQNLHNVFTPDVLTSIAFCAEILPDEESTISTEDLEAIRNLLVELETMLEVCQLPIALCNLLKRHVELIHKALSQYKIIGATAFREAAYSGLGEIITSADTLRNHENAPEVEKLKGVWTKVNKAADAAIKIEKLNQLGHKIGEALSSLGS